MATPKKQDNPKPSQPKPEVPEHVREIKIYFDSRDSSLIYPIKGRFVALKKSDIRMHMRARGLTDFYTPWSEGQKEVDWPIYNAQMNHLVDYAGSLAGHRAGVFTDASGRAFLATDEASGVWADAPKEIPEPEWFKAFIQELLPEDQWLHFCYWLAIALHSLRRQDWRPGQVAVLAGPAECGKSLLQYIITQVLGGRVANPWSYIKDSKFNYELAGAEHWAIEDPDSTLDTRTRVSLGNRLKECANNENFFIHRKGRDGISLPLFRRISLSINDEPEFVGQLPPMDKSVRDKITLYKCSPAVESLKRFIIDTPPLPGFSGIEGEFDRRLVKEVVSKETPLIRFWLLSAFKNVPKELRARRNSIVAFHHPELMEELSQMSAEMKLLNVIDQVCFDQNTPTPWTGKSIELEHELRESKFGSAASSITHLLGNIGSYLGKLAKTHEHRVTKRTKDGYVTWVITTPPSLKETTNGTAEIDNDKPPF